MASLREVNWRRPQPNFFVLFPRGVLEGKKIRWQDGVEALYTLIRYRFAPLASFARTPASQLETNTAHDAAG